MLPFFWGNVARQLFLLLPTGLRNEVETTAQGLFVNNVSLLWFKSKSSRLDLSHFTDLKTAKIVGNHLMDLSLHSCIQPRDCLPRLSVSCETFESPQLYSPWNPKVSALLFLICDEPNNKFYPFLFIVQVCSINDLARRFCIATTKTKSGAKWTFCKSALYAKIFILWELKVMGPSVRGGGWGWGWGWGCTTYGATLAFRLLLIWYFGIIFSFSTPRKQTNGQNLSRRFVPHLPAVFT